ncbi:MAG: Fic family protein, partial [Planctomycetes bacterium]|nr:Fic family protein [Planctomycetota bacterium]
ERVATEMDRFLTWFESAPNTDPILKAAIAHLWFLAIHPFDDGNGRIGRAICDLALTRADGAPLRTYSLSAQFEAERTQYYLELEAAQRGGLDITEWILWFLGCLDRAVDRGAQTLQTVMAKSRLWQHINTHSIQERQRLVLTRFLGDFQGPLTTAKYAKLAKCSHDTALRDIKQLLEWGILVANEAGGRSTSYRAAEPA